MDGDNEQAVDDLLEAHAAILAAFNQFGMSLAQTLDSMVIGLEPFFEYLEREHPEAFDESGTLRDDWAAVIGVRA